MKKTINNIRDFKNINFVGGSLCGVTPKNLYFDYNSIKKKNYLNVYLITIILTWIREIFGLNLVGLIMKQLLLNQ